MANSRKRRAQIQKRRHARAERARLRGAIRLIESRSTLSGLLRESYEMVVKALGQPQSILTGDGGPTPRYITLPLSRETLERVTLPEGGFAQVVDEVVRIGRPEYVLLPKKRAHGEKQAPMEPLGEAPETLPRGFKADLEA